MTTDEEKIAEGLRLAPMLEQIRESEAYTEAIFDDVVQYLLDHQGEFAQRDAVKYWKDKDPKGWHSRRYARSWASRWLAAATHRGELSMRNPGSGCLYSRPPNWGTDKDLG